MTKPKAKKQLAVPLTPEQAYEHIVWVHKFPPEKSIPRDAAMQAALSTHRWLHGGRNRNLGGEPHVHIPEETSHNTDPRRAGGAILEADLDLARAVMVDHANVVLVEGDGHEKGLAIMFEGKIGQSDERASILNLLHLDEAAVLVATVLDLIRQGGREDVTRFNLKLNVILKQFAAAEEDDE